MNNEDMIQNLIALTAKNTEAIENLTKRTDSNSSNITWLFRFGITVLLGMVITFLTTESKFSSRESDEKVKKESTDYNKNSKENTIRYGCFV